MAARGFSTTSFRITLISVTLLTSLSRQATQMTTRWRTLTSRRFTVSRTCNHRLIHARGLYVSKPNWLTLDIVDLISSISDPEHPLSLGSLAVVNLPDIHIMPPTSPHSSISTVLVEVTPTITHCSLATVIGLGVRVRLEQALPPRFRVDVRIKKGTHSTDEAVNKQLGDKERVAAALENGTLMGVIRKMLSTCE